MRLGQYLLKNWIVQSNIQYMTTATDTPTQTIYTAIERGYGHFNMHLFDGQLPDCLITLQRKAKAMGYVSPDRWVNERGQHTDELAVNPEYFLGRPLLEVCQTLVHEMCHIWQYHHGQPGRRGYHNREWAQKMRAIGLVASDTGAPGGKKTGESMSDYILYEEKFWQASQALIADGFTLPWLDAYPATAPHQWIALYNADGDRIDQQGNVVAPSQPGGSKVSLSQIAGGKLLETMENSGSTSTGAEPPVQGSGTIPSTASINLAQVAARKPTRVKYRCPCGNQVWGKPALAITCGNCKQEYDEI